MFSFSRPLPLRYFIVALAVVCGQASWAQSAQHTNPLADYVPMQDQLCDYCGDFSAATLPAGTVATLYRFTISYTEPVGTVEMESLGRRLEGQLTFGPGATASSPSGVPTK